MASINKLKNLILHGQLHVFAYNPKDKNLYLNNIKDLPRDWILYPNPYVKEMELEEADLKDEELKKFIFNHVLPNVEYIRGEKQS